MALTGEGFQNIGENFEEYEGKINAGKNTPEIAEIIANHRADLFFLLAKNKIEWTDDENNLQKLQNALETKKQKAENDLWKYTEFDFTDNKALQTLWESIAKCSWNNLYNPWWPETQEKDYTSLKASINTILQNLQYLHFDFDGTQETSWYLFEKKINESSWTWSWTLLQTLYNEKNYSNVNNDINKILNDKKDNELYISKNTITKLENPARNTAIRIALYCYAILKICEKDQLSKTLKSKAEQVLKQIQDDFLPKLKLIYNAYTQLKKVKVWYETVKEVNKCINKQTENGDLSTTQKEISVDLEKEFKNKTDPSHPLDFNEYNIETKNIEIKDRNWNKYPVSIKDTSIVSRRNITVKNKWKIEADLQIEIWWQKISIGKMGIDTISTPQKAKIDFFDNTTLQSNATTAWVSIPFDTLTYTIPLQGTVLTWAVPQLMVAATKTITWTLTGIKATAPVPPTPTPGGPTTPPPPPAPAASNELTAVITDTDYLAEKKARLEAQNQMATEFWDDANLLKKAEYYFFRQWIEDRKVKNKLTKDKDKVTLTGEESEFADRLDNEFHQQLEDFERLNQEGSDYDNYRINDLCKEFLNWHENDSTFKTKFEDILKNDPNFQRQKGKINNMGSNILIKLKGQQAREAMLNNLTAHLRTRSTAPDTATKANALTHCETTIESYIENCKDIHSNYKELLAKFLDFKNNTIDPIKLNDLNKFIAFEKANLDMLKTNLNMKLKILTWGTEAHHINNEGHEKRGLWWLFYKCWTAIKKHPFITTWAVAFAHVVLWVATGGLSWLPVLFTWTTGGLTFLRKWSDYTASHKEQAENRAKDPKETERLLHQRERDASLPRYNPKNRWKRHKAKRQIEIYHDTISKQSLRKETKNLTDSIMNFTKKIKLTWPDDEQQLKNAIIEAFSRLQFHKETWYNLLKSSGDNEAEMNQLKKAVLLWVQKLDPRRTTFDWDSLKAEIETWQHKTWPATPGRPYDDYYKELEDDFKKKEKKFTIVRGTTSAIQWVAAAAISYATAAIANTFLNFGEHTETIQWINEKSDQLTGNFDLWAHDLVDTTNNITQWTQDFISNLQPWTDLNDATITIDFWAWTDDSTYIPWHEPTQANLTQKITEVKTNIDHMSGLSQDQKNAFKDALDNIKPNDSLHLENDILQAERQAEFLEKTAEWFSNANISDKNVTFNIQHNDELDTEATVRNSNLQRNAQWIITITKDKIDGTEPVEIGKYVIGAPTFWNTYRDDKP